MPVIFVTVLIVLVVLIVGYLLLAIFQPEIASKVVFWIMFLLWFIIQIALLWAYWQIVKYGLIFFRKARTYLDRVANWGRELFNSF